MLGWEDALLAEIGRATIGFTSRRTARSINRLKGTRFLTFTPSLTLEKGTGIAIGRTKWGRSLG